MRRCTAAARLLPAAALLCAAGLAAPAAAAAGQPGDPAAAMAGVAELDGASFAAASKSKKWWFIEWYVRGCGWCQKLAGTWEALGEEIGEKVDGVRIGKFDMHHPDARGVMEAHRVRGSPYLMVLKPDGTSVQYSGPRELPDLVSWVQQESGKSVAVGGGEEVAAAATGTVITLSDAGLAATLRAPTELLIVFRAAWCARCRRMQREWAALAAAVKDDPTLIVAEIDADKYSTAAAAHGVDGLPAVQLFRAPSDPRASRAAALDYEGGDTVDGWLAFVQKHREVSTSAAGGVPAAGE